MTDTMGTCISLLEWEFHTVFKNRKFGNGSNNLISQKLTELHNFYINFIPVQKTVFLYFR